MDGPRGWHPLRSQSGRPGDKPLSGDEREIPRTALPAVDRWRHVAGLFSVVSIWATAVIYTYLFSFYVNFDIALSEVPDDSAGLLVRGSISAVGVSVIALHFIFIGGFVAGFVVAALTGNAQSEVGYGAARTSGHCART